MARIRTVKPELFRHEGLYELEQETGLPIRISFAGLFTACDREGRFCWRPRQLKLDVLPYDNIEFLRVLDALVSRGFIVKYENSGELYGCIPTFSKHQIINNKERKSYLPSLDDEGSKIVDAGEDLTRSRRVSIAQESPINPEEGEGKGRERNGKEGKHLCQHADDVSTIFEYWAKVMGKNGRAKLTKDRQSCIVARLKESYTVAHIMQAIDGCKRSEFHMGKNDKATVYDDLTLICRSGSHIEKFAMNIGAGEKTYAGPQSATAAAFQFEQQRQAMSNRIAQELAELGPDGY